MILNIERIKSMIKEYVSKTETEEVIKKRRTLISDILLGKVYNNELTNAEVEQGLKERETTLVNIIESPIFIEAIKICVNNNFCSTSLLQKKFNIGYSKAVDIIDAMEALCLLAPIEKEYLPKRKISTSAKEFLLEKEMILRCALNNLFNEICIDNTKILQIDVLSFDLLLEKVNVIRSILNQRQMEVIEFLYGFIDGTCYSIEEIGQKFSVTRERVRQINAKALKKIREYKVELDCNNS